MPARPTGAPELRAGKWFARVVIERKRRRVELSTCRADDEPKASARAELLADLARRLRRAGHRDMVIGFLERAAGRDGEALDAVLLAADRLCSGEAAPPISAAITVRELGEQWTTGELHRRWPDHVKAKVSADDDRERLEAYVYPLIGSVAIPEVTIAHADAVMSALPPRLARSTRRHVAQVLARLLNLAAYPARIIPASPLPRGFLPKPAKRKALSYLYPDEDRLLLGSDQVPLHYRVYYGFLAREGMRRGEAASLTWGDVDIERGAVVLDENKTGDPRAWALDPGVARALERWRELRGKPGASERVFVDEAGVPIVSESGKACPRLRKHLRAAGVLRSELYERSPTRIPIRLHDLRATFITVALACGRTETWVADRTGHTSSVMINRYRRAARRFAELGVGDLEPLDRAVPELLGEPSPEPPPSTDPTSDPGPDPAPGSGPRSGPETSRSVASTDPMLRIGPDSRGRTRTGTPLRTADFESPSFRDDASRSVVSGLLDGSLTTDRDGWATSWAHRAASESASAGALRGDLIRLLGAFAGELAAVGDLAAARVAHAALGRLIGEDAAAPGAEVVDLEERRR